MVPPEILEKVHRYFKIWRKLQISLELSQEVLLGSGHCWINLVALRIVALRSSVFWYVNAPLIGIYWRLYRNVGKYLWMLRITTAMSCGSLKSRQLPPGFVACNFCRQGFLRPFLRWKVGETLDVVVAYGDGMAGH